MDHWVLVDNTDPGIQYSGPWFTSQIAPQLDPVNPGPPFVYTLHGANVSASLSFPFNGSEVMVFGSIGSNMEGGGQNTTWECFVDDQSIGVSEANEDNHLCQKNQLQDGLHVLTVNASVSSPQPFLIDKITYLPSSNLSLAQAMIRIDSSDSAVQYSRSEWSVTTVGPRTVMSTQTAGSMVTYEFLGVSISWFGAYPSDFPIPSSATYSVDGQTPVNFTVPASTANFTYPFSHQAFFQTQQLSNGEHKLVVTHQGNSSTAPLALAHFVVDVNGTLFPSNSTSSSSGNAPTSNSTSNSGTKIGAIIGSVLGGFIFLLILFFYIRRHNHQRAQKMIEKPSPDDLNPSTVRPFQVSPALPARNHTSGGQSLTPQTFPEKLPQRRPVPVISLADAPASTPSSVMPVLAPSQNDPYGMTNAREAETVQQPTTIGATFLWHDDSGVRIPFAQQGNIVELPPSYTQI